MHVLYQIADLIFTGYPFVVFLIVSYKIFSHAAKQQSIIESNNLLLLIASYLNLIFEVSTFLIFIGKRFFMGGEQEINEQYMLINRMFGPYWFAYWGSTIFTVLLPQLFFIKKLRIGMYLSILLAVLLPLEYTITTRIASLFHGDFLPSSWAISYPVDIREVILESILYLAILVAFHWARAKVKHSKFFTSNF